MGNSYIPEHVYGVIPGTYGEMGLIPWPAHMTPGGAGEQPREHTGSASAPVISSGVELTKKGESYVAAALAEADGVFFLTLDKRDRTSIATTVERLINMLDDLDGDPDLETADKPDDEPILGAPECHPASWAALWGRSGVLTHDRSKGQANWANGHRGAHCDECEDVSEDEGALTGDDEHSLGWENEGSQTNLGCVTEYEADLGTTEEIDQVRRDLISEGWQVDGGEPLLGWCENHGRGVLRGESDDDREQDAGDEAESHDGEQEQDAGDYDYPAIIAGGGSVSQHDDGWRPVDTPAEPPRLEETARVLPNGDIAREIIDKRKKARARKVKPKAEPYRIRHFLTADDFDRQPWA